jgi:hypothetical protein
MKATVPLVMLQTIYITELVPQSVHMVLMLMNNLESVLNVTLCVKSVTDIQMVTVLLVNKVGSLMDICVSQLAQPVNMLTLLLDLVNLAICLV